jgi:hypothetical protein
VATVVARNANDAMVGSGGICVRRESGVRRSVLCWCVWQEPGFSRREDVFTFYALHGFCTFNVICKDNAAINCITVQHKRGSFRSTLKGYATLVSENKSHFLILNPLEPPAESIFRIDYPILF